MIKSNLSSYKIKRKLKIKIPMISTFHVTIKKNFYMINWKILKKIYSNKKQWIKNYKSKFKT